MQEIEIPPRDSFKYYVQVTEPPKTIMWNFTTKRNNIAFGLFKQDDSLMALLQNSDGKATHQRSTSDASTGSISSIRKKNILPFPRSKTNLTIEAQIDDEETDSSVAPVTTDNFKTLRSKNSNAQIRELYLKEILSTERYESAKGTIKGQHTLTETGTYVLYFDNSFSRNTSKKLTFFVAMQDGVVQEEKLKPELTGWLLKKKRKKMQGWAKRYFVCDHGQLSYFKFPAGFCRGSIPIALSTITIDPEHHIINIDSGSTLWHLRALTQEDYGMWIDAIRRYKAITANIARGHLSTSLCLTAQGASQGDTFNASLSISDSLEQLIKRTFDAMEAKLKSITSQMEADDAKLLESKKSIKQYDAISAVYKTANNGLAVLREHRQDVQDLLDCEVAKSKSLEAAYRAIITENIEYRRRLGLDSQQGMVSALSQDLVKPPPHLRSNSLTSSHASDAFYDAQDLWLANTRTSSSDELATKEMVIYDNQDEEDDSDESVTDVFSTHASNSSLPRTFNMTKRNAPLSLKEAKPKSDQLSKNPIVSVPRRLRLPSPMVGRDISLLSILRKNGGKDLTSGSMPISLNEPLNLLQKLCEELEYSELLDQAAQCDNSLDRLMYVTAFAISGYASTYTRISRKPFNPLLGETYECVRPDKGFRFISEKVSHNPPVMASYAISNAYEFYQDNMVKPKFWGKSIEFIPSGTVHVKLSKTNDHFSWSKVTSCMRNFIGGDKSIDHYGTMTIINHTTGEKAEVLFKENGGGGYFSSSSSSKNEVLAALYDSKGSKARPLYGKWNEQLISEVSFNKPEVIWQAHPVLSNQAEYYGFTQFAIELNEITPDIEHCIPTTDTRFRPDQRAFELGKLDEAEQEKVRLEEKQRAARRQLEEEGKTWTPLWFEQRTDPYSDQKQWIYRGSYWESHETGIWPQLIELW